MKRRSFISRGRAAFTLIELVVTMGLMGLLGAIATGGYFAATRGMASRGAIQDTASIIRATMQSCLIDQVPTAVIFYNYRSEQNGDCYGRAIAIRMGGRVSYLAPSGNKSAEGESIAYGLLVDEFADWNQSYSHDAASGSQQQGNRLYNMSKDLDGGIKNCSSLMCVWVGFTELTSDYMINAGGKTEEWLNSRDVGANVRRWGLPFHPRNDGLGIGEWKIGDAYGTEIAEFTLPRNYIFGTKLPTGPELTAANDKALIFTPDDQDSDGLFLSKMHDITITMVKDPSGKNGNATEEVGTVSRSIIKDQD